MIAYLRGRIQEKKADGAVVDVGGVGYLLQIPLSTFYRLPAEGGEQEFFVHTHVREDQITLYGFASRDELTLFRALVTVHGFGPKSALTVLSGMEPDALVRCLTTGDVLGLCKIPGVGKKTAERLIYELREKLPKFLEGFGRKGDPAPASGPVSPLLDDLVSAMVNLGYALPLAEKAARRATAECPEEPFEALLKATLRHLMSR